MEVRIHAFRIAALSQSAASPDMLSSIGLCCIVYTLLSITESNAGAAMAASNCSSVSM